jgi:hypothetical protein
MMVRVFLIVYVHLHWMMVLVIEEWADDYEKLEFNVN